MMNEQTSRIEEAVESKLREYLTKGDDFNMSSLMFVPENKSHIIRIGTSILCTSWGVGAPGGSFVQAIVENNLQGAYTKADSINQFAIRFYCYLLTNQSYID